MFAKENGQLKTINAASDYVIGETGYYRVECVGNFETNYLKQEQRLGAVIGAVSKSYNSNDFITGYDDSATPYAHEGEPTVLTSMTIRVIDPATNLPVAGLGKNSTVFLEVGVPPPEAKKCST